MSMFNLRGSAFLAVLIFLAGSVSAGTTSIRTVRVASGLARPVFATSSPDDPERLFILEQHTGRIQILNLATGLVNATPFLTVTGLSTGNEQGLLGLAFHPEYRSNGIFYVNYTNSSGTSILERYLRGASPDIADPFSGKPVISFTQPFPNHNGGWLGFGPNDGYLYISSGDGGSGGDPGNRAQDITSQRLGKLLRIDVNGDGFPADSARNYAIPPDNPFVGLTGDDEIWAYGLRNPWRCAFDRANGDLYIADVGQNEIEEIDFQPAASAGGENYGWRCYEGNAPFIITGCPDPATMVFPIHEYTHGGSPFRCSVTGGYVYRGCAIPDLQGTYFFADYCSNQIWSFRYDGASLTDFTDRTAELDPAGSLSITNVSSFGEDFFGEMYICELSGEIFKIVPDSMSPDTDGDTVIDDCDNCPADVNADQADLDGDSIGDLCDADADGDGFEGPIGDNQDCDDLDPLVSPGTEETPVAGNCADTLDNDCDGLTDIADPACAVPCICGDLDDSGGAPDLADFAILAVCFGRAGPSISCDARKFVCSDLNGDGLVNLNDFGTFALLFNDISSAAPPNCLQ